ncbi:MAG TPA: preQ(1) synthase [Phycisphaerae bacterium]|nr:preQ(1) synthase [Phycisphaerae bacterium]HRR86458.1 preQ(1) synthase [Phycisphaerae bacterium]
MDGLHHLGKPSNQPTEKVDLIEWSGQPMTVRLECSEFTSLCPVTGQPDFGQIIIEYVPGRFLVETKSLKLYLWKYRSEPGFNESLVDRIASDLFEQIRPLWLRVRGQFNPRGGIRVTATAERGDNRHRPS